MVGRRRNQGRGKGQRRRVGKRGTSTICTRSSRSKTGDICVVLSAVEKTEDHCLEQLDKDSSLVTNNNLVTEFSDSIFGTVKHDFEDYINNSKIENIQTRETEENSSNMSDNTTQPVTEEEKMQSKDSNHHSIVEKAVSEPYSWSTEGQTLQINNSCQLDLSPEILISEALDVQKKEERVNQQIVKDQEEERSNQWEKSITKLDEELTRKMDTELVMSSVSGLGVVPINEKISGEQLSNTFSVGSLNYLFAMTKSDLDTTANGDHPEEQIKSNQSDQKQTCVVDGGGSKIVELMEEKCNLINENVNIEEISEEVDSLSKKELDINKWECTSMVQSEIPVFWTGLGTDRTEESVWETKYEKTEFSGLFRGQCHLEEHLKRIKSPLIGLEYIVEVWQKQLEKFQHFECMICYKTFDEKNIIQHLTETNHKILYLEKHIPKYVRKFPVGNLKEMNSKYLKALEDLCKQLEKFYGRQQMYITTDSIFSKCKSRIKQVIEEGPHYSECKEISFPSERRRLPSCPHKSRESIRDLKCTLVKCKKTSDSKPASMSKESRHTSSSEAQEVKSKSSSSCSSNAKKRNDSSGTRIDSYHSARRGFGFKSSFRESERESKHAGLESSLVEKTAFNESYRNPSYVCHKHHRLSEKRKHNLSFLNQKEAEPTEESKRISTRNRKCKYKKDTSMNDIQHYERDRRLKDTIQGQVSSSKEKERKNSSSERREHDQRSWSPKNQNQNFFLESSVRHYSMVDNHGREERDRYQMPIIRRRDSQEDSTSKRRRKRSPPSSSIFNESGKDVSRITRRFESKNSSNFSWISSEYFHFDRNKSRSQETIRYSRARPFRRHNTKKESTAGIKDVKKGKLDDSVFSFFQDLFTLPKTEDKSNRYDSKQTYSNSKDLQRCSNYYQLLPQQNVDQVDKIRTSEDCEVKYCYKVENTKGSACPLRKERLKNTGGPSVKVVDITKQSNTNSENIWKVSCGKREKDVLGEARNSETCDFEEAGGTAIKEYKNNYFPNLVSSSSLPKDKVNINLLYKREPYSSRTVDHTSENNKYNIDTSEIQYDSMYCLDDNLGYRRIIRSQSTGDNQEPSGNKRLANIGEISVSEKSRSSNIQFISTDHDFSNNSRSFDTSFQELSPYPLAAASVQENKLELKILEALQKSGYSYNELSTEGLSGMYKEAFADQVASVLMKMGLTGISDAALAGIVQHLSYGQQSSLPCTTIDNGIKEEIVSYYKDTSSVERVKETLSKLGIPLSDMSTKIHTT
ncbi:uncharacterized protein LOC106463698 [Limulus polyphemus]|uniref:Uncharacterized protein LOC106463698 n=1 Tax=Limulus polyphemus TaxID=6850 RepID=A0ABM1BCG5_LIMPO|nr:uncharacterized protein LOC106463698 [Limulus polyphemus]XP_022247344.1 uncharacterized protein LOC106463698 [Limulus polyphemus]